MRWSWIVLMGGHALLHLLGFVRGLSLARVPQLTQPISPPWGVVWLAASATLVAMLLAVVWWPKGWWMLGAVALVLSQTAIVTSWADAKYGTIVNVLLFVGILYGFLTQGPLSLRAAYEREVSRGAQRMLAMPPAGLVTESELVGLPAPVRRNLQATGAVGQPHVTSYRVHYRGRIRAAPTEGWMSFDAVQQSFTEPPARLFLMSAHKLGIPVQAFHRLVDGSASMTVKLAGVATLVQVSGPVMDRSETVTLFNDMCILAPGSLLSPAIRWEAVDDHTARAHFTSGTNTIAATLLFDDAGRLVDFVSDDRSRLSADGRSSVPQRFSTPLRDYRPFGPVRLASYGEARWRPPLPAPEFAYGEFHMVDVAYTAPNAR